MSLQSIYQVMRLKLAAKYKMVLLIYADHADNEDEACIPVNTGAQMAGVSVQIFRQVLESFERDEVLIETDRRSRRGGGRWLRVDMARAQRIYGQVPAP